MKFVNIRELSKSPSKYIKSANEGGDVVITRNGLPYAIISRIDGSEFEDYVLVKHFNLEVQFKRAKNEYEMGDTISAHDLLKKVNKE